MESEKNGLVTAASIQIKAEIFSFGRNNLKGTLFSQYLDNPYEFISLLQMIDKMEEIFDSKHFPEAFVTPRAFGTPGRNRKKTEEEEGLNDMKDSMNGKSVSDSGSSKCTFEISVKFRQNATWQGQILWVEKDLKQNFRSVLEMLKLMDEALVGNEAEQDPLKWEE